MTIYKRFLEGVNKGIIVSEEVTTTNWEIGLIYCGPDIVGSRYEIVAIIGSPDVHARIVRDSVARIEERAIELVEELACQTGVDTHYEACSRLCDEFELWDSGPHVLSDGSVQYDASLPRWVTYLVAGTMRDRELS